jgi:hypothetical protein
MPRGATDLANLLLNIAQSMNNVGYQNPSFVDFVKFLLQGRTIRASFLSAETPPGAVAVVLDLMVVCGGTAGNPALLTVTVRRTGVVEWEIMNLRQCAGVAVSVTGNLAVAAISLGSAGTALIATAATEEGDLNIFALEAARAAGF